MLPSQLRRHEVVIFTYSSIMKEEGTLQPSRLSAMAADAAFLRAAELNADGIVIAAERAYGQDTPCTGELVEASAPENTPPIRLLKNHENDLLNTSYQVQELAREMRKGMHLTMVGWGFHQLRILANLKALGIQGFPYEPAEDIINRVWQTASLWDGDRLAMSNAFRSRYGFEVDWPEVRDGQGLRDFAYREQRTRRALLLGKDGRAINWATTLKGSGRRDDLDPYGNADFGHARTPRFRGVWRLAAAVNSLK